MRCKKYAKSMDTLTLTRFEKNNMRTTKIKLPHGTCTLMVRVRSFEKLLIFQ